MCLEWKVGGHYLIIKLALSKNKYKCINYRLDWPKTYNHVERAKTSNKVKYNNW